MHCTHGITTCDVLRQIIRDSFFLKFDEFRWKFLREEIYSRQTILVDIYRIFILFVFTGVRNNLSEILDLSQRETEI